MATGAPDLETVPCPICGTAETTLLWASAHGWSMGRCPGCRLVRQNPRVTAEALRVRHYDGRIQEEAPLPDRRLGPEDLGVWNPEILAAYEASVSAVDTCRESPRGVWLDVGASTGSLLLAARAAGWQVAGVEPGRGQVRVCREVHDLDVSQGTLREVGFPEAFAGVVSYRHVLEHVHDVAGELAEARRVLAEGGLLLVEVPNFAGSRYGWGRLRTALRLSRSYWERLNVPEHLYYFTPSTLRRLLTQRGFAIVSSRTYGRTGHRTRVVRRLYARVRDALRFGNRLRVVARRTA